MTRHAPPGWPSEVPPPGAEGWPQRATSWLFDHAPAELRSHAVLRRHPAVLAWWVVRGVDAQLDAARSAYAAARREVGPVVGADVVPEVLAALEAEGARLLALQRSVRLVADALTRS